MAIPEEEIDCKDRASLHKTSMYKTEYSILDHVQSMRPKFGQ